MRFSNSTGKLNQNLLCTPFRKVEDYEKEVPSINEIERKYTHHHKSSSLSFKKRTSRKLVEIPQMTDDFNNLSLEKQVEVMMRPITGPGEKAENLLRLLEDEEHSKSKFSSKETEKLTLETEEFESSHRVHGRNILQELKYQPSSVKISKSAKESISLPPLKDNDPLFTTQTAKHWHYHQPIKHTPRNIRPNINANPADVSVQKTTGVMGMETKFSLDKTKIFFSQSKNRLKTKNLVVLTGEGSVQRSIDTQNTSSSRFPRSKDINFTTRRKLTPNENLFPNVTPNNHQAIKLLNELENHELFKTEGSQFDEFNNEVNRIIERNPMNQGVNTISEKRYNEIKIGDLKPENNVKPSDRPGSEIEVLGLNSSKLDMSKISLINGTRAQKAMSSTIVNRKSSQTPSKKKEYYNKWFMPVKYWNASNDIARSGKKSEELKKDANYFYHNLHNYASQQIPNIAVIDKKKKTDLQLNYENLQEKLKQNMVMKKYKKQLADNGDRIPIFLKNVEEDINANK